MFAAPPQSAPAHTGQCKPLVPGRAAALSPRQIHGIRHRQLQPDRRTAGATSSSGLTSSVSLGPSVERSTGQQSASQNGAAALEDFSLDTESGVDYSKLRDLLVAQNFREADDETRALLITLAGPEAEKRNWVYFTEVKFIGERDLQILDGLWRAASGNKFGYSAQKQLWVQNGRRWDKFFKQINWVQGERNYYRKWPAEFMYTKDAAKGHLPLTNCLRGTQLFAAILEHPAFVKAESSPAWLKK